MTIREVLLRGANELKDSSETPRLDASVLLADLFGWSREELICRYPEVLDSEHKKDFFKRIVQRKEGTPVAYLTGMKEFYGITFRVDSRVLIPRPDTEILVETAAGFLREIPAESTGDAPVLDCCTGSGCIGIALKSLCPDYRIDLCDLSPEALDAARRNRDFAAEEVDSRMADIGLFKSDLLESLPGPFSLIASNPPYLTPKETEEKLALGWGEPSMALDGGEAGLYIINRLVRQASQKLISRGILLIEAGSEQMDAIEGLFLREGLMPIGRYKDLSGLDRVAVCRR